MKKPFEVLIKLKSQTNASCLLGSCIATLAANVLKSSQAFDVELAGFLWQVSAAAARSSQTGNYGPQRGDVWGRTRSRICMRSELRPPSWYNSSTCLCQSKQK